MRVWSIVAVGAMITALTAFGGDGQRVRSEASAADADWEAIVEAAEEEGSLSVYTPQSESTSVALEEAFEAAYPEIDLSFTKMITNDMISAVQAEYDNSADGADVIISSVESWLLEKSELEDFWAAEFIGPAFDQLDDSLFFAQDRAVLIGASPYGFAWNTDEVDEPLTSYADLLRDDLKGRIATFDYTAISYVLPVYFYWRETLGDQWLVDLAAQDPIFLPGAGATIQPLVAGEIAATAFMTPSAIDPATPVEIGYPERPWAAAIYQAITGNAQHPKAAQVFANWMMTPEGQAVESEDGVAALPNIETALFDVSQVVIIPAVEISAEEDEAMRTFLEGVFGR